MIKKDGPTLERKPEQVAASSLDFSAAFQLEEEVMRLCDAFSLSEFVTDDMCPELPLVSTRLSCHLSVVVSQGGGGDEFMAVKPWIGAIVEPSRPPTINPAVPSEELHLQWVHGYRAQDSTNNLRYTAKGEIVYPAAALGVLFNSKKWSQRYMFAHTDDVIALAIHPDGVHVATGQMGKRPTIVVWNTDTMAPVVTLQGLHRRAVCQLDFSADGRCVRGS